MAFEAATWALAGTVAIFNITFAWSAHERRVVETHIAKAEAWIALAEAESDPAKRRAYLDAAQATLDRLP